MERSRDGASDSCERASDIAGIGIFTATAIAPGEVIMTIEGPRTPDRSSYSFQIGWNLHVEPEGRARYVNHSCDPNSWVDTSLTPPVIRARRAIRAGEEITVDYSLFENELPGGPMLCSCGNASCRREIVGFEGTPMTFRQSRQYFVAEYLRSQIDPRLAPRDLEDLARRPALAVRGESRAATPG